MLGNRLATSGAAVALTVLSLRATDVVAGDHHEAPLAEADPAADIADLYAWHEGGNLIIGLSWAGYTLRESPEETVAFLDPDVLYGLHIDTNADNVPDHDIYARFGQDEGGNWGVQVENLPGVPDAVSGPVEQEVDAGGGAKIWAGIRDDPFFFDSEGFRMSLASDPMSADALKFDKDRDFALFQNATLLVVEFPLASLDGGGASAFQVWATTARK
jgi:hypothetical protein